jgi:hypothetical protein
MNDWLKILEANREGKFNYYFGPTPRFVIGGCQIPIGKKFDNEELAKGATREMFEEMKSYKKDGLIVISINCYIQRGPVLALSNTKWSERSIGTSYEKIWERYGKEIVDGNYHIDKKERSILEHIFQL